MKRIIMVILLMALVLSTAMPSAAFAHEKDAQKQKVVRVGWFESSFCSYDKFGRRCGIDYEYQQKFPPIPDGSMNTWKTAGQICFRCWWTAKSIC